MRSPARTMIDNLMWTRSGSVWAIWRLQPLPYGWRPDKVKQDVREMHVHLLRALKGEALLMGVCARTDPTVVVERMIEGVDLDAYPDWAAECEATLDSLEEITLGERGFWLAVPLRDPSGRDQLTEPLRAGLLDICDTLGLVRPASVSERELARRRAQAREIAEVLPAPLEPTPATPAQLVWLMNHAQQRGLPDLDVPPEFTEQLVSTRSGAAISEPIFDEGARSDFADRKERRNLNPLRNRVLKVIQPGVAGTETASYQALLAVADVPEEMAFPGTELLGRVDECGAEVDWTVRLEVRSTTQVSKDNKKALNNLNDQYQQRHNTTDVSQGGHGMDHLARAAANLAEYDALLTNDQLEVEIRSTVLFAVAGPDRDTCNSEAQGLAQWMTSVGVRLEQPPGFQEALWWAMLPGSPESKVIREFAQVTTSRSFAALVPLASTDLGDGRGSAFAMNISSPRLSVVHHDIAGAATRDVSGSLAMAGELGAGKSAALKTLAGDVAARGGQIIVPDRTAMGEWAMWAQAVTRATVVDIAEPAHSLDPLRTFGTATGAAVARGFLSLLLGVNPREDDGLLLSEILTAEYLTNHELSSVGAILEHLRSDQAPEGSLSLARKMGAAARQGVGAVIFDDSLPPVSLDSAAIVVRTHTLEMPSKEELELKHLYEEMKPEKMFGRAIYALVAGLAREVLFRDRSRLGMFAIDEAHHLTTSSEGLRYIIEFVRDGRKHSAAVALGSHDPLADFGDETLRGLIPTRILMRHRDRTLARRGIEWLDLDPDDDDLVDMVRSDTSPVGPQGVAEHRRGEAFMRDSSGSVGRIRVMLPALADRNAAARTSPPETV